MRRFVCLLSVILGVLFISLTLAAVSSYAQPIGESMPTGITTAGDCLEQVGEPYEKGDQVCIKVKNVCTKIVAVSADIAVHNFGLAASEVSSSRKTVAIEPGETAEICTSKPGTAGKYCFRFWIRNLDRQHPADSVYDWLNNVPVVASAGSLQTGSFQVGGFEPITTPIVLETSASQPGWQVLLSHNLIDPSQLPATVNWTVAVPPSAPSGQVVTVTVLGLTEGSTGPLADLNLIFTVDPKTVFLPLTLNHQTAPAGGEPPVPVLFYPEQESGTIAGTSFLLAWDGSTEYDIVDAQFEYQRGPDWIPIGPSHEEPLDVLPQAWQVKWDTHALPAGEYPVRVTLTDVAGQSGMITETVRVAKLPVSQAVASFFDVFVTFDGSTSFDPDGAIVQWAWDFGDGTQATGITATHSYSDPTQVYYPTLTVIDDEGYQATTYYETVPADLLLVSSKTCGCASMDVKTSSSSGMDMWWMTNAMSRTLGGHSTIPDPLPNPAPAGPFYLLYNFEVEAKLKDGSDPALCTEGQWVKGTFHYDSRTGHKTENGEAYPYTGKTLGPDDYTEPSSVKEHAGLTVRWVDGPGLGTPSRGIGLSGNDIATSGAAGVTWQSKFFAIVSGPAGTCDCTWEVEWTIQSNGAVTQAPTVKNKVCSSS
ncbi:Collagenase ColH [Thermoflexales bacterium]|nr:Collagenase ColH [Thermoflexales bacterium]